MRRLAIAVLVAACNHSHAGMSDGAIVDASSADAAIAPRSQRLIFALQAPSVDPPYGPCSQAPPVTASVMTLAPRPWQSATHYLARDWVTSVAADAHTYAYRNTGTAGTSGATFMANDAGGIVWTNMGDMDPAGPSHDGQMKVTYQMCRDDFANYVLPHLDGLVVPLPWSAIDQGGALDWTAWDPTIDDELADPSFPASARIAVLGEPISSGRGPINAFTPSYVFTQEFANASAPDWSTTGMFASGWYLVNQSVHPSDVPGHYFRETVARCHPGSQRPSWVIAGPTPDGDCSWIDDGANAHPQDTTTGAFHGTPTTLGARAPGVYNIDSPPLAGVSLTAADLASGYPVAWETPFLVASRQFATATIAHLTPHARIAYIRFGSGDGGESNASNLPELQILTGNSYDTLAEVWSTYVGMTYLASHALQAQTAIPITASVGSSVNALPQTLESPAWADAEADQLVTTLGGLGNQGIVAGDKATWQSQDGTGYPWTTGKACAGDWCNLLDHFGAAFTRFTFQTLAPTDPTNTIVTGVVNVGTLPDVLGFVSAQAHLQPLIVFEMFCQGEDCFGTWDPNYSTYADAAALAYPAAIDTFRGP